MVGDEVTGTQRIPPAADCVVVAEWRAGPVGPHPEEHLGEFPEGFFPGQPEGRGTQADHP